MADEQGEVIITESSIKKPVVGSEALREQAQKAVGTAEEAVQGGVGVDGAKHATEIGLGPAAVTEEAELGNKADEQQDEIDDESETGNRVAGIEASRQPAQSTVSTAEEAEKVGEAVDAAKHATEIGLGPDAVAEVAKTTLQENISQDEAK